MTWNEMTTAQRILTSLGWICMLTHILLTVLDLCGLLEDTDTLSKGLFAVWCLTTACTQKTRRMKNLWYGLAAAYLLLAVLWLFA